MDDSGTASQLLSARDGDDDDDDDVPPNPNVRPEPDSASDLLLREDYRY